MIDPPNSLDVAFIDWLERAGEELSVIFVDRGGLSDEEIVQLQAEIESDIPAQIREFYRHCNPYGMWRDKLSVWRSVAKRFRESTNAAQPLLPLDLASLQGNHTVAMIETPETFRIADMRSDGSIEWHDGDLRTYFTKHVNAEKAT